MKAKAARTLRPWERRRWRVKAPMLPPARKRGRSALEVAGQEGKDLLLAPLQAVQGEEKGFWPFGKPEEDGDLP